MFYTNHIKKFIHQAVNTNGITIGPYQFAYFEDVDDVLSISNQPYQRPDNDTYGGGKQILKLAFTDYTPSFFVWNLLLLFRNNPDFQLGLRTFKQKRSAIMYTLFEKNAVLLKDFDIISSAVQPLPYRTSSTRLYFQNLGHSYSPLFFIHTFELTLWMYFIGFIMLALGLLWIWRKLFGTIETFIISYRIILLTLLLLLTIFNAAFGATLDILLAIKKTNLPFDNIAELFKREENTLCVQLQSSALMHATYFRTKMDGGLKINPDYCPLTNKQTNAWQTDPTFRCNKSNMFFFMSNYYSRSEIFLFEKCDLVKFPEVFVKEDVTVMNSIEFPLKENLNRKIIKARTSGLLDYIINTAYFKEHPLHTPFIEHSHLIIEFDHCKLIILILIVGYFLSLIIFGIEILINRFLYSNK